MANHKHNDGKLLGMRSTVWGYLCILIFFGTMCLGNLAPPSVRYGNEGFVWILLAYLILQLAAIVGWVMALIRGWQANKEQEGRKEIQKILSSPNASSKLTTNPKMYKQAQAELQARKEDALKMQELHALRQQVEDEERKAGIFAPTLSPTRSQADPMAAEMARLAQRKVEAERQKHLMKSLRTVEDVEWEADDV